MLVAMERFLHAFFIYLIIRKFKFEINLILFD